MRTSLNDIKLIDNYLHKTLSPTDQLLFQVRLLINPAFKRNVILQQKLYELIRIYYGQNLKADLEQFHTRMFNDPLKKETRKSILNLFLK
jgi:hypothetical protein